MAEEQRPWHRLFALSWMDFFHGLPVTVEMEKDLSLKQQRLDVVILRKEPGPLSCRLPDGFEELTAYNLVSFKSHQEKLSAWALEELIGHYVNLRKQVSPSMDEDDLLAADQFRLYAVSTRYPQQLASSGVVLQEVSEGVYEVQALTRRIRVIVANQLPRQVHNAMLHLFSTRAELLTYGVEHYRIRSAQTSTLLLQLYLRHQQEGQTMPDELEKLYNETIEQLLKILPVEKRLKGLSAEQLLQGLSAEQLRELAEKIRANGPPAKPE
jgi:hypothetical protein